MKHVSFILFCILVWNAALVKAETEVVDGQVPPAESVNPDPSAPTATPVVSEGVTADPAAEATAASAENQSAPSEVPQTASAPTSEQYSEADQREVATEGATHQK